MRTLLPSTRLARTTALVALLGLVGLSAACSGAGEDEQTTDTGAHADAEQTDAGQARHTPAEQAILDAVDPFIGTAGIIANLGNASPAATAPLGMVKVGPDTSPSDVQPAFSHCSGYLHTDKYLLGFSHNRLHGTGIPDYGNILLLPTDEMSAAKATRYGRKVPKHKDTEQASPGRYRVALKGPDIDVTLTATPRCALHRYAFAPGTKTGVVLFDVAAAQAKGRSRGGAVSLDRKAGTLSGWSHAHGAFSGRYDGYKVWFTAQVDRPVSGGGTWSEGALDPASDATETSADPANFGAWVELALPPDGVAQVKVCLSYVGVEGAEAAMKAELPDWDAEAALARTEDLWLGYLGKVEVKGADAATRTRLYTALYHTLQMPTLWGDVDGRYRGFDREVHQAKGFRYVTDLSLWDTFRTTHPLYALLWPEVQRDALESLAVMTAQGGYVPRWPMGGGDGGSMIASHGVSVAADSVAKGQTDWDVATLYEGLSRTLGGPLPAGSYGGLPGIAEFHQLGWVPAKVGGSVSKTQEYAQNCAGMATLATHLGKAEDAKKWAKCATFHTNVWEPKTRFFRARKADGTWVEPFDPLIWHFDKNPEYVEGSGWQWRFFAPHDEAGLRQLFGGDAAFAKDLDFFLQQTADVFSHIVPTVYYYHGNEPDIDAAWLFVEAGKPARTQHWTRWITTNMVLNKPDGLPGNDDGGTLAAWTVFATLGLYPRPGTPRYILSAPLVDEATLHLPGGQLIIRAPGAGQLPEALSKSVSKTTWKGEAVAGGVVQHSQLAGGGALVHTLK